MSSPNWIQRVDLTWCWHCGTNAKIETSDHSPLTGVAGAAYVCLCCGVMGRMLDGDAPCPVEEVDWIAGRGDCRRDPRRPAVEIVADGDGTIRVRMMEDHQHIGQFGPGDSWNRFVAEMREHFVEVPAELRPTWAAD